MLLTFFAANFQAVMWQSSSWLVSTVLPAVVIDLTNSERSQSQVAPLVRSAVLDAAAQRKAEHMAQQQYFAHYSPDGVSPWYWFDQVGYRYAHAGENLAIHFTDSSEVVEAWMQSPAHRQNIIGQQYREIGVGTAKGKYEGYDTVFVVQLFGTPAALADDKATSRTTPLSQTAPGSEITVTKVIAETTVNEKMPSSVATKTIDVAEGSQPSTALTDTLVVEIDRQPTAAPIADNFLSADDVVTMQLSLLATSSGLAVAQVVTPLEAKHAGFTMSAIATQPNTAIQFVYTVLGILVVALLSLSIVRETRSLRYTQVAYGVMLLGGMGTLWYVHMALTGGAVVI